jgi:hypothetical protein
MRSRSRGRCRHTKQGSLCSLRPLPRGFSRVEFLLYRLSTPATTKRLSTCGLSSNMTTAGNTEHSEIELFNTCRKGLGEIWRSNCVGQFSEGALSTVMLFLPPSTDQTTGGLSNHIRYAICLLLSSLPHPRGLFNPSRPKISARSFGFYSLLSGTGISQSVYRRITGWTALVPFPAVLCSPLRRGRLWGPPGLLSNVYRGNFPTS